MGGLSSSKQCTTLPRGGEKFKPQPIAKKRGKGGGDTNDGGERKTCKKEKGGFPPTGKKKERYSETKKGIVKPDEGSIGDKRP